MDHSTVWATTAPSDALQHIGQYCQQLLAGDEWKSKCLAAEAYALLYRWPILHSCRTLHSHPECSYLWSCTVVLVVKVWIFSNLFWHGLQNRTICQCWLEPNNSSLHRFAKDLLEAGALTWSNFSAKCNIRADFFNQPCNFHSISAPAFDRTWKHSTGTRDQTRTQQHCSNSWQ